MECIYDSDMLDEMLAGYPTLSKGQELTYILHGWDFPPMK